MMNKDIYNIIKDKGLRLSSPTFGIISDTTKELETVLADINKLPVITPPLVMTGVPQSLVDSMNQSVTSAISCTTQAATNIHDNLNNLFTSITQNSLVNMIDGDMQSCSNLLNLTGSVTGEIDSFLESIKAVATQQIQYISDYLAGRITELDLQSYLDDLMDQLEPFKNSIETIFEKEKALFLDLKNQIESSTMAKMIEQVWNNPCAQAILDKTLPADIKGLLNG